MIRGLAVAALGLIACDPAVAPATELARGEFLRRATHALRVESCAQGGGLRRCSDTSRDECEHVLLPVLRTCSAWIEPRLPPRLVDTDQRQHRAELMGCMWHHTAMALGPARLDLRCWLTPPPR